MTKLIQIFGALDSSNLTLTKMRDDLNDRRKKSFINVNIVKFKHKETELTESLRILSIVIDHRKWLYSEELGYK